MTQRYLVSVCSLASGSLAFAAIQPGELAWTRPIEGMQVESSGGTPWYAAQQLGGDGRLNTLNAAPSARTWPQQGYVQFHAASGRRQQSDALVLSAPTESAAIYVAPGAFDISSSTSYWNIAYQGSANDAFNDQQTGQAASDLIGDATHPVLYRYYDPSTTYDDHTGGMMYFRARVGGKRNTANWGPFDNVLSIGLDFNTASSPYGKMDMFIVLDVHNPSGQLGLAMAGNGANTSPSTTTIGSFISGTTVNVDRAINTNVYNFQYLTAADGITDLENNGAIDGWVSFGVPFSYVVSTARTQMGLSVNDATPIKWGFGTSTQMNSFNQDINGFDGKAIADPTWTDIYTNQNGNVAVPTGSDHYHPAVASAITPSTVNLGSIHAGGTFGTQALTLSNSAANDGFAERLNAGVGLTTGDATASGSINLLPAGSTSSAISVGLNGTATGGKKTGTVAVNLNSDGTGTSGNPQSALQSQTVTVTGYVYNYAAAAAGQTVTVKTHAGQAASVRLTLTNSGPADATYTETLSTTGFSATSAGFTATGSASGIAGGASDSGTLAVGVGSALTPGSHTGSTTLGLRSNEVNGSGLGNTSVGTQSVTINAEVYRYASPQVATTSLNLGNVHLGGAFPTAYVSLSNSAPADGYSESLNGEMSSSGSVQVGGSVAGLAPGQSSSALWARLTDTATAGAKSGTATMSLTSNGTGSSGLGNSSLGSQTLNLSGAVYRYAAASLATQSVDLGRVHVGGAFVARSLSLTNSAASDGYSESLNATISAGGSNVAASGSFAGLGAQQTNPSALLVNLNDTATAGAKRGTANVALVSNGTGSSGLGNTALPSATVSVSGMVYSGQSAWSGAASSSWSNFSNWDAAGGVPGVDGALSQGHDTATFSDGGLARTTVNLNGASPEIRTLSLSSTGGNYTIAAGTGGTLNLTGIGAAINVTGTHTISAPIQLSSNTQFNVAGVSDRLIASGQLQGAGTVTKTGDGVLVLTNTSSANGSIIINDGSLRLAAGSSVSGDVTANAGGWLTGDGAIRSTLQFNEGAGVSPGDDVGIGALSIGTAPGAGTSHLAGGTYRMEIAQITGTGGSQDSLRGSGFDTLNFGGAVAMDATPTSKFTVDVRSLTLSRSSEGALSGWEASQGYSWTIMHAEGGITGFDPSAFTINTTGFYDDNSYQLGGDFHLELSTDQKSLVMSYSVPEPGIVMMASAVLVGGCSLRPRRRREEQPKLRAWRTDEMKTVID